MLKINDNHSARNDEHQHNPPATLVSAKPIPILPIPEGIPDELKQYKQWVVWRYTWRTDNQGKGKWTKPPINALTGNYADSTASTTWVSFDEAWEAFESGLYDGVGFVFTPNDPYAGFDLDDCFYENEDTDRKELKPEYAEWVTRFATYTEYSPSGNLKGICKATAKHCGKNTKADVEFYDRARYFTLTGDSFHEPAMPIAERQTVADEFCDFYFPPAQEKPAAKAKAKAQPIVSTPDKGANTVSITERIEKAFAAKNGAVIRALFEGDISAHHGDASAADLALCSKLAFWSENHASVLDAMFRQSRLMRKKWDEKHAADGRTYGEMTIDKALSGCDEFYQWTTKGNAEVARTTFGNADRFVKTYGNVAAYNYKAKYWLWYDGKQWKLDAQAEVEKAGKNLIRGIQKAALTAQRDAIADADIEKAQKLLKFAMQCQTTDGLNGMLRLAQSDLAKEVEEFDADPWVMNIENGLLNLKTFELKAHSPEHYATRLADVSYDPQASCPRWLAFLDTIFKSDKELIKYVQKAAGYSLTGDTSEQCAFVAHGNGRNGKSTFLGMLDQVVGNYAATVQSETLMAVSNDSRAPREDLARLCGVRLVSAIEAEDGKRFAESLIKQLTGGDKLTARFLYGKLFEFKPAFKIWLACNHRPQIRGADEGIWRRIRLIPFEVQIPEDQVDKNLSAKLAEELPGILNWCLEGLRLKAQEGFEPPAAVVSATEGYREDMDVIGRYLSERTVTDKRAEVISSKLYADYCQWAEEAGEHKLTQTAFSNRLSDRGLTKRKDGVMKWYGIGLAANSDLTKGYFD